MWGSEACDVNNEPKVKGSNIFLLWLAITAIELMHRTCLPFMPFLL